MAGMFSEYWSALRTSTGPRSSRSALRGVHLLLILVVISMSRDPGVIRRVSKPVA